jgi:histone-lysine N-methyltransferase SETMAR
LPPRPTKVRPTIQDWKQMMKVTFHKNWVLGYRILAENTNVNFEVYLDFLSQVTLPAIKQLRIHRPIILNDNARPHKHSKIQDFFARHRWEELKHQPYSPDLNPCDYDGIYRIKRPNKDKRFNNPDELETPYKEVIDDINLKGSATGIGHLPLRWANIYTNPLFKF